MKRKVIAIVALLLCVGAGSALAQSPKIGYANPEYIISQLPQLKQLETQLKELEGQLQKEMQNKLLEYDQKVDAYRRGQATMSEMIRQEREKEITKLDADINAFQEKAQQEMQKRHGELMQPIMDTVQKAIKKVADEKAYTYILSTHDFGGGSILLYAKNEQDNISDLVLKELGITPPTGQAQTGDSSGIPLKK